MKYTLLAMIVACVVLFIASGCSVYYPTSYRAFIPRILDSEYKEYQRLCKEEVGKVVYAREIQSKENIELFWKVRNIKLGNFIDVEVLGIEAVINKDYNTDNFFYLFVGSFTYYTGWTEKNLLSLLMEPEYGYNKQYIRCQPLLYGKDWKEESAIIEKIALDNKESIGGDELLQEYGQIHVDYDFYPTDISQIFKKAVYTKSPHYLGNKKSK